MRVSTRFNYLQNLNRYTRMQDDINRSNARMSDDFRRFHEGYDDSTSYSEALRLDNEIASFKLIQTAADKAVNYTKNSDNAVSEIARKLDDFKVKLLQSTNEIHSSTSLNAIANDMQQIRNHIVNIANTSINGQFLFSGTAINTKPFENDGSYNGNSELMHVVLGAKVEQPYNLSGAELFCGRDNDYKKVITSNNRMIDRRYDFSHPEDMHYIDENSRIRDLIGREYLPKDAVPGLNEINNFRGEEKLPDTYFYVSGTRGNGESFRAKFAMRENEQVSALLKRVGEAFGNTDSNKVVDIRITNSGTIEVTDLINDHSRLNFSMFAATSRSSVEEVYKPETLREMGYAELADKAAAVQQKRADEIATAAQNAKRANGEGETGVAESADKKAAREDGADGADGADEPATIPATPLEQPNTMPWTDLEQTTITDKADQTNIDELRKLSDEGEIFLLDFCNNDRPMPDGTVRGHNYARTQFDVQDQFLRSNVVQYHKDNRIAQEKDRLIDCVSAPLNTDPSVQPHTVLVAEIASKSSNKYKLHIDLTEGCVRWEDEFPGMKRPQVAASALLPGMDGEDAGEGADGAAATGVAETGDKKPATTDGGKPLYEHRIDFTHKVYDPATKQTYRRKSGPEEITFAQLGHMLSLFASDNLPPHDIIADDPLPKEVGVGTQLFEHEKQLLDKLFDTTDTQVNASLERGRLMFEDCTSTTTNIRVSLYDEINLGEQFEMNGSTSVRGDVMSFATNSSLVIDEQQIDLVRDLDQMIAAVRSGQYRADKWGKDTQNPGLQGSIRRLDHLYDHVNKCHTKIGSMQNAIQSSSDRALSMQVNIFDVKQKIMGAGPDGMAEATLQLKTTMQAFEMVLQASAMINKLSLLDYMR